MQSSTLLLAASITIGLATAAPTIDNDLAARTAGTCFWSANSFWVNFDIAMTGANVADMKTALKKGCKSITWEDANPGQTVSFAAGISCTAYDVSQALKKGGFGDLPCNKDPNSTKRDTTTPTLQELEAEGLTMANYKPHNEIGAEQLAAEWGASTVVSSQKYVPT